MIRNNNYNQHLLNSQESDSTKFFAIVSIIILTLLNCIGLKESSLIQNILTFSKILLVISIFLIAMVYSFYHPTIFYENLSPSVAFKGTKLFSFGSSMVTLLLLILLQIIYNINYYHY